MNLFSISWNVRSLSVRLIELSITVITGFLADLVTGFNKN